MTPVRTRTERNGGRDDTRKEIKINGGSDDTKEQRTE